MNMLKGTFQNISSGRKLLLFVFFVLGALLIASVASILVAMLVWGNDTLAMVANPDLGNSKVIAALKVMQLINSFGGILLPALAFLWLADAQFFTCSKSSVAKKWQNFFLTVFFILAIQPFVGLLTELNEAINFPSSLAGLETKLKSLEENALLLTKAFVSATTIGGLLFNILLMAILPAISEELMFRAALGRLFRNMTGSIHWAVIISAIIFSAFHMQFYGFLPRFILGAGLGYLFFWSGSIWWPILAHFINNGVTVVASYLFQNGYSTIDPEQIGVYESVLPGLASLLVTVLLLLLFRRINGKRSPAIT